MGRVLLLASLCVWASGCQSSTDRHGLPPPRAANMEGGDVKSTPLRQDVARRADPLYVRLDSRSTGIQFENVMEKRHPLSHLYVVGTYAGGGVCVGDFDDDGRPDVFLSGQARPSRLYRQAADFRFQDVTDQAGLKDGGWATGASFVDIDNDGDLDLYVCHYNAANQLYLNQGDGSFVESARSFGLDYRGASIMASFADYDCDGHVDMYLLTNRTYEKPGRGRQPKVREVAGRPEVHPDSKELVYVLYRPDGAYRFVPAGQRDYLYRNQGDGTFRDVSAQAGISRDDCYQGLSATWWDDNDDGRPDLYVSNDFWEPDRLYRNNGDGTFQDVLPDSAPHTPWFSMGSDAADVNNDGRIDFLATDMAGTTHFKRMTTMGVVYQQRWFLEAAEPRQYMRNALYVNTGTGRFLEAAQLAGVANTDWTWSPIFGDLDNDGWVDLLVTNGVPRNLMDSDLYTEVDRLGQRHVASGSAPGRGPNLEWARWKMINESPPRPEANLAYRNLGDLRFEQVGKTWGLDHMGISFGAVLADLDRDGDLDIVMNNVSERAGIYRNVGPRGRGVLVRLAGQVSNRFGVGASIEIKTAAGIQKRLLRLASGFMSAREPLVHFGLGDRQRIDRLTVRWPSGHRQTLTDLTADCMVTVVEPRTATPTPDEPATPVAQFTPIAELGAVRHRESPFDDYRQQPLLPHKLSQLGPGLAWADMDADGDDDFFLAGSRGYPGQLYRNLGGGKFVRVDDLTFSRDAGCEDMAPLLFDADGDGDLDLYISGGSYEFPDGDPALRDRLYWNDGHGRFRAAAAGTLPDTASVSGPVAAADFDGDGDLDLFVGGRVVPGAYPLAPGSRLLRNEGHQFVDTTAELAPRLKGLGMVTGAIWSDADDDGRLDLLVTEQWGPIHFFHNSGGQLVPQTAAAGLADEIGWWNGITGADLNGDGRMDYIVTNLGLNTQYHATHQRPSVLFYGDLDLTGRARLVEAQYEGDRLLPIRGRMWTSRTMPRVAKKYPTYRSFASATVEDLYTTERLKAVHQIQATRLESCALINVGNRRTGLRFEVRPLPNLAQIAPAFGIVASDFDGDGFTDVYCVQNSFSPRPETGRMDGGLSLLLRGDGTGQLAPVWPARSGLVVPGDAMAATVSDLNDDGWADLVVTRNNDTLLGFFNRGAESGHSVSVRLVGKRPNPTAVGARVTRIGEGQLPQTFEVYAGSGYLSQCSSTLFFGCGHTAKPGELRIRWPNGQVSKHDVGNETRIVIRQP